MPLPVSYDGSNFWNWFTFVYSITGIYKLQLEFRNAISFFLQLQLQFCNAIELLIDQWYVDDVLLASSHTAKILTIAWLAIIKDVKYFVNGLQDCMIDSVAYMNRLALVQMYLQMTGRT